MNSDVLCENEYLIIV